MTAHSQNCSRCGDVALFQATLADMSRRYREEEARRKTQAERNRAAEMARIATLKSETRELAETLMEAGYEVESTEHLAAIVLVITLPSGRKLRTQLTS